MKPEQQHQTPRYVISVLIGDDVRSVNLTEEEYKTVTSGVALTKKVDDDYEGETYTYEWQFNEFPDSSLVVSYSKEDDPFSDGEGFVGDIHDADVEKL